MARSGAALRPLPLRPPLERLPLLAEGTGQRVAPLENAGPKVPEPDQCVHQAQTCLDPLRGRRDDGVARLIGQHPGQRRSQVAVLSLESLEPGQLLGGPNPGLGPLYQLQEVLGMAPVNVRGLAGRLELLEAEFPDGLQHPKAWLTANLYLPQEALVDQRSDALQDVGG